MTGLRPHPWNESFRWTPSAARSGRLTPEQVAAFDRDGYLVLESVVDPTALAELLPKLDELEAETDAFLKNFDDDRLHIAESGAIIFGIHASTRYDEARRFAGDHLFADLCHDLIGPDARLYWDQIVYKLPDKPRRFPFHQDNGYGFVEPQQYLTCWVALTDVTVENGCPWLVPGVHLHGTIAHEYVEPLGYECFRDHPDAIAAEVPAGSVIVFSSLTPHMTGPNTTDTARKAYILQYAPDGAELLKGEPAAGPPERREPAADPTRQFFVLQNAHYVP